MTQFPGTVTHVPGILVRLPCMFDLSNKNDVDMKFSNASEGVLALISLVLTADQVATDPERNYLFNQVGNLDLFRVLDEHDFIGMMSSVNEQLFGTPDAYDALMQSGGVHQFCEAFKAVVPASMTESAFQLACEIASSDGLIEIERDLLHAVGAGLGISRMFINQAVQRAEMN